MKMHLSILNAFVFFVKKASSQPKQRLEKAFLMKKRAKIKRNRKTKEMLIITFEKYIQ
jgi:hypothetical protein